MSQIARLKEIEIANGNLINADDLNAEFNQLVSESNGQDTRMTAIESSAVTLNGVKTFNAPPRLNQLDEAISQAGIRIDGVQCHDGLINPKPVAAVITSIDIATDQITTSVPHGLITGYTVGISVASANGVLPTGLNETTVYCARVVSSTVITLHLTENDASFGVNPVNITAVGSGTFHLIRDNSTVKAGDIWVNQEGSLKYQSLGNTYTVLDRQGRYLARHESHTAAPVYVSSTTFTVDYIASRDWANTCNIVLDGPITVDITTSTYNGIVQYPVAGTVTVTTGTNTVTVTGGSGGFIVGDVIVTNGGQTRHVTAVDGSGNPTQVDSNWTTTETNVSFKYGGRCANTWYYAYESITFGVTCIILSTRNAAAGQTPDFATTAFRQMPFAIRLDVNANILPFAVSTNRNSWDIFYRDVDDNTPYRVLNGGTATAAFTSPGGGTNVDCSSVIPPISKMAYINTQLVFVGSGTQVCMVKNPDSNSTVGLAIATTNNIGLSFSFNTFWQSLNATQRFAYRNNGSAQVNFTVMGYRVTEVR